MSRKVTISSCASTSVSFSSHIGSDTFVFPSGPSQLAIDKTGSFDERLLVGGKTAPRAAGISPTSVSFAPFLPHLYDERICGGIRSEAEFTPADRAISLLRALGVAADKVTLRLYPDPASDVASYEATGFFSEFTESWAGAELLSGIRVSLVHTSENRAPFTPRASDAISRGRLSRVSSNPLRGLRPIPESAEFGAKETVFAFSFRVLWDPWWADPIAADNGVDVKTGFYVVNPANGAALPLKSPMRKKRPTVLRIPASVRDRV